MKRITIELDAHDDGTPILYAVYSGTKRIVGAQVLHCICSDRETADRRAVGRRKSEVDFYDDDALYFWVEEIPMDHLFGARDLEMARRLIRSQWTGG